MLKCLSGNTSQGIQYRKLLPSNYCLKKHGVKWMHLPIYLNKDIWQWTPIVTVIANSLLLDTYAKYTLLKQTVQSRIVDVIKLR